jgi:glycyl-tRNA synthetase beta chain
MFAIGQPPTGSKDPFALRRAAIGVLRILVERALDLNLLSAIDSALQNFAFLKVPANTRESVFDFLLERFRAWYLEEGVTAEVFQSVIVLKPERPLDFHKRLDAVNHFSKLPQSQALAAANKRVTNILAKLGQQAIRPDVDTGLLQEPAEQALFDALSSAQSRVMPLFDAGDYRQGLEQLASLKESVDGFFDQVLVMCEDEALQANRIALLSQLRNLFLQVADISCLHNG